MLRLTWAQTRAGWRRLSGALVAISLGAAFVTATLLGGSTLRAATHDALLSSLGPVDLMVIPSADATIEDIVEGRTLPGVSGYSADVWLVVEVSAGEAPVPIVLTTFSDVPSSHDLKVTEGNWPAAPDEIALPHTDALALNAEPGTELTLSVRTLDDTGALEQHDLPGTFTLVGILASDSQPNPGAVALWDFGTALNDVTGRGESSVANVLVTASDPLAAYEALSAEPWVDLILTREQLAADRLSSLPGAAKAIEPFAYALSGIAIFVASLVVANTFQVLVVQRTRQFGLLRSVGATRRQIRSSVLLEALGLGIAGGFVGVIGGYLLTVGATIALSIFGFPLTGSVTVSAPALLIPLITAVLITLGAAWYPAHAAMRVMPLHAVRSSIARRAPRGLLVKLGLLLGVLGWATVGAVIIVSRSSPYFFLGNHLLVIGVIGALASIVGLLMAANVLLAPFAGFLGRLFGRILSRPATSTVHIASANIQRNPRRSAATANALFVGVALVCTLLTTAHSARVTLSDSISSQYPTDIQVESTTAEPLTQAMVDELAQIDGIAALAEMNFRDVIVEGLTSPSTIRLYGADPETAALVMPDASIGADLADGVVLSGSAVEGPLAAAHVALSGAIDPSVPPEEGIDATVRRGNLPSWTGLTTTSTLARIDPSVTTSINSVWIRTVPGAEESTADAVRSIVSSHSGGSAMVATPGVERMAVDRVISVVLSLAVGLLMVSILIALLGVTNTLSLSVFERRHEIALMRAIGMRRRQVRRSLAIEGLILTVTASITGIVVGTAYGFAGVSLMFTSSGTAIYEIPWTALLAILAIATVAGPVASIAPARKAARVTPIMGLASE